MRNIITEEVMNNMITDYHNGMKLDELSKKYGFQNQTIQKRFKKIGITVTKSNAKKFTNQEIESMIIDYKNGVIPSEMGKKYNRNPATIIGKLKELGIYKNKTYRFTEEDISFLKKYYPLNDWNIIHKRFPNTPKSSIHTKMCKLGISATKYHNKKWSDEEIRILEENYQSFTIDDLVLLLPKRKKTSIMQKANTLGLVTRKFWSDYEIDIMNKNYHNMLPNDILNLLPERSIDSIIGMARKLGLVCSCRYSHDETEYIINNWYYKSDKEIAAYLHKSITSVINKRCSFGLLRLKEQSSYNDLSEYIRRNNIDWKNKSMINCGYKCVLSGNRFDDIHHIYGLNLILNETMEYLGIKVKKSMNDYSDEELRKILKCFREIQSCYPLGICLSKEIHKQFHNIYGYGCNTEEQWNQFVENYKSIYNVA